MYDQRKATLLALAAVALWSTVATAFKLTLRHLDPYQLLAWASVFATLVLLTGAAWLGRLPHLWPCLRRRPYRFVLLGLLNPVGYYLMLFRAYELLPAQQAQSINYTWAITLGLLSVPLLGRPYGLRDGLGALLGYAGVLLIATRGDPLALQFDSAAGVALALLSTLIWAVYWILNTRLSADPLVALCLCFVCGLPFALAACVAFSQLSLPTLPGLAGAAYVGLFEMGVTFVIWLSALRAAENISKISNLIFLSPFLSLLPITLVLGERVLPATLAGLACIIAGTLVQQARR